MSIAMLICPPEKAASVWYQASKLLQPAADFSGDRCDMDQTMGTVLAGTAQLWLIYEDRLLIAAIVTELRPYPKRTMNVLLAGGTKMEIWLAEFIDRLKRFAKYNTCDRIEMVGRKGWLRKLDKFGFVKSPVVMMELEF